MCYLLLFKNLVNLYLKLYIHVSSRLSWNVRISWNNYCFCEFCEAQLKSVGMVCYMYISNSDEAKSETSIKLCIF